MRAPFLLALPLMWIYEPSHIAPPVGFVDSPPALSEPETDAELWIELPPDPGQEATQENHGKKNRQMKRK